MDTQSSVEIPFTHLPEGTVTFLFTDIEGSTQLLQRLKDKYTILLSDHHRILREAFVSWGGHEVDTQGDAFFIAFSRATQAVGAAVEAQRKLSEHIWPERAEVRVRMGIHTGESWTGSEGYVGMEVHRAARIAHVGNGGQVLLSETSTGLVRDELPQGVSLLDLGRHLLKDIHRPERISQLTIEGLPAEFPPLRSLEILPPDTARLPRKVGTCPYRGLSAFQEVDTQFYFGRETFINALEQAVSARKLVAVIVGSSGSGKSSVIFAGLLPRLRKTGGYQFATFRPGNQPFYNLAGAIVPLLESGLSKTDLLVETRKLAERLAKGEVSISQVIDRIRDDSPTIRKILLIIDQLEELYTMCQDGMVQKAFMDELLAAIESSKARRDAFLTILLTMRADFMGQALAHRPFADAMQEASLLMGPMTPEELHDAIEKPAEMQGAAFEAGLVERILDDVGDKPGNLPLLEFTLTQLWDRQTDGWLTHSDYEAMGCVQGALAAYADQVYGEFGAVEQNQIRHALIQMVQPGEGTEDTRRITSREELGEELWSQVQQLASKRLVVTGRDAQGLETAEVVHEALIQRWRRFRDWMDADRSFRVWQEQMRVNLRQWLESGQDEGALLSGVPLVVAENWLTERPAELSELEQGFIRRGIMLREQQVAEREAARLRELEAAQRLAESEGKRAEEQARAAGRLRGRAMLLAGASVVAIILAVFAFLAFRQANTQQALAKDQLALSTSRELAAAAVTNLRVDPERSVLLALEALSRSDTLEARNALHQALPELRIRSTTVGDPTVIYSVSFSPDGTRIATGGFDYTAKIWDVKSQKLLLTLQTNEKDVYSVQWSPDGKRLATSGTTDVIIWDTSTGQQVQILAGESVGHSVGNFLGVGLVDFSPDGTRLAVANQDGDPKVWDLTTATPIFSLPGHTEICWPIAFSPDGKLLATGGHEGLIKVWDAQNGRELLTIHGPNPIIKGVDFSPDSTKFVSVDDYGYLTIWEVGTGEALLNLVNPSTGGFMSVKYLANGSGVVTTSYDSTARIWDATTGQQKLLLAGHTSTVVGADISPDGRTLATGAVGGTFKLWDLGLGYEVRTFNVLPGTAGRVAFSPDGTNLAAPATDGKVRIWEHSTGELVTELSTDPTHPWKGGVSYSPNGAYLAAGAQDGVWALWELATGRVVTMVNGHSNMIEGLTFSPDGQYLGSSSFDGTVKIWDLIAVFESGGPARQLLTFTGHQLAGTSSSWAFDVVFSPDGKQVASVGSDTMLRVWDSKSGQELFSLPGGKGAGNTTSAAISPDGRLIAVGQLNGVIRVWKADTQELVYELTGHSAGVFNLEFNVDGTLLASASFDMLAKIWDMISGQELASFYGNAGRVMGVAFSPDGTQLATGADDGSVRIYAIRLEDLITLARSRLTRSLTTEECRKYLHQEQCPAP